jgi:putative inorganic carbon (HCO3(-)) transporter
MQPPNRNHARQKKGRTGNYYADALVHPKLNNWLGITLLLGISCLFAWLFKTDLILGLFFFGVLVVLCIVIMIVTNIEIGFYLLLFTGFYGYYWSNFLTSGNIPVGAIFDSLVLLTFLGLIMSRRDIRSYWREFVKSPVIALILVNTLYGILEMLNPNTMGASASNWLGVRKVTEQLLLLFTAYVLLDNHQKIRRFIFIMLLVTSGSAIYGCIQEWHGLFGWELRNIMADPHAYALLWAGGEFRKFSTFNDPAAFGILMAISCIFFLILSVFEKDRSTKLIFIVPSILMMLAMGYSGTRTAYAIAIAGIAFFILLNIDKPPIQKFAGFMLVIFLALMFGPFSGNGTVRRFRSTFMGEKDESFKVRVISRAFIQPYIRHHPIGGGMGTTGLNGSIEHPGNPLAGFQPDGSYVMKAAELGWIGLFLTCILYFYILKAGIQAFFRTKDPQMKAYYAAGVSCIFAFYVGDYAQLAVGGPADVPIYFAFIAMILNQKKYDRDFEAISGA